MSEREIIPNGSGIGRFPRVITEEEQKFLDNVFKHHTQEGDQAERQGRLRRGATEYAILIIELCAPGVDRDEALRNVQQAAMWSNASVVRVRP